MALLRGVLGLRGGDALRDRDAGSGEHAPASTRSCASSALCSAQTCHAPSPFKRKPIASIAFAAKPFQVLHALPHKGCLVITLVLVQLRIGACCTGVKPTTCNSNIKTGVECGSRSGADLPLAARLAPVSRAALHSQLLAQVPQRGVHAAAVPVAKLICALLFKTTVGAPGAPGMPCRAMDSSYAL